MHKSTFTACSPAALYMHTLIHWCSFGSWWTTCNRHGIWHVAISNVGCCSIDHESKHITIAMDLSSKDINDVLHACYHLTGFLLPDNLVGIVASPPCTTFSNFDLMRRTGHRDTTKPHRPAMSKMAKEHDTMVLNLLTTLWPTIENKYHVQDHQVIEKP